MEKEPIKILIGGSPCFEAGTLVLTDKGLKNIEDLKIGDKVYTHKNRYMPITAIGNKEADIYNLKTQGVFSTHVTENHPYYSRNIKEYEVFINEQKEIKRELLDPKWISVKDLNEKTYVSTPIINESKNIVNLTKEQCWILGRYVLNGYIENDESDIVFFIKKSNLNYLKNKIKTFSYDINKDNESTYKIIIKDKNLANIILNNDFGTDNKYKNIPGLILNLPLDLCNEFLDGYLLNNNPNNKYGFFRIYTIHKKVAFSLALLLQKTRNIETNIMLKEQLRSKELLYIVVYQNTVNNNSKSILDTKDFKLWQPIKTKKYVGKGTVYNISVEEDESYIANNLVVHNCTFWSISQKPDKRETTNSGQGWELFKNYLIAKEKFKPDYFLYENNESIDNKIQEEIEKSLGIKLLHLNSNLVSAQVRKRIYGTNIVITKPLDDKKIYLEKIIEKTYEGEDLFNEVKFTEVDPSSNIDKSYRIGTIGKGGQGERVYSTKGKSVTLSANGGGRGAKTGLYLIDGKVRKLNPKEAERLQTLPDDYTLCDGVSANQRYKCIGNGWTADIIIFILSNLNIPKDTPIEVLSMYDGIATGRYCFEKLGFTNVTYKAYEIDNYAIKIAKKNYPDIIECGDAFKVRDKDWKY